MSKTLTLVSAALGVVGGVGMILMFVGMALPEKHIESVTVEFPHDRSRVWGVLTDFAAFPAWWPKIKSVEKEIRSDGMELWWNTDARGRRIAYVTEESTEPSRLVRKIANEDLPFGGSWTFELEEQNGKTRLTLTEESIIRPPVFRALFKYLVGYRANLDDFLAHLGKKVG